MLNSIGAVSPDRRLMVCVSSITPLIQRFAGYTASVVPTLVTVAVIFISTSARGAGGSTTKPETSNCCTGNSVVPVTATTENPGTTTLYEIRFSSSRTRFVENGTQVSNSSSKRLNWIDHLWMSLASIQLFSTKKVV